MDKTKQAPPTTEATGQQPARAAGDRSGLLAGASVFGAVLASSCCIVPLALFSLGIGGAWIANLTALAPYKPYFATIAGALILAGFISMRRRRRRSCDVDGYCATTLSTRVTTVALWASSLLVIVVLLWPYLFPILIGQ